MSEKEEKKEKEDLPKLDVPKDYKPYSEVSVERKNERFFRDFADDED